MVCADFQGLKDAIADSENGFMVPQGDARAWAAKIRVVFADGFDREAFGRQASEYTLERFSWSGIAGRYLKILESGKS